MPTQQDHGPQMAERISHAVGALLEVAIARATELLQENAEVLKQASQQLIQKEIFNEQELKLFSQRLRRPPPP